jgi:hypothetical protein
MWHRLPSEAYRDVPSIALPMDLCRQVEIVNSFANTLMCKNFGSQLGSTANAHKAEPWVIMDGLPNLRGGTTKAILGRRRSLGATQQCPSNPDWNAHPCPSAAHHGRKGLTEAVSAMVQCVRIFVRESLSRLSYCVACCWYPSTPRVNPRRDGPFNETTRR